MYPPIDGYNPMQGLVCIVTAAHSRNAEATARVKLGSLKVDTKTWLCCNATADAFLLWEPNGIAQSFRKGGISPSNHLSLPLHPPFHRVYLYPMLPYHPTIALNIRSHFHFRFPSCPLSWQRIVILFPGWVIGQQMMCRCLRRRSIRRTTHRNITY